LISSGHAYRCDCSKDRLDDLRETQMQNKEKPRYDGCCRHRKNVDTSKPHVIRFKNPETGVVAWDDLIKGPIEIANTELDDLIIARSDGSPTYNLTVVVDDYDMKVTHVLRGDDHINNTPRQINLFHALGATIPQYGHVSMILGEDGKRLSKRHGAASVMEFRNEGYLPDALLNYLVRLGWSHGDQEIFTREEMIAAFSLEHVNNAAAAFNYAKLKWTNQQHLKNTPIEKIEPEVLWHYQQKKVDLTKGPALKHIVPVYVDRVHTLVELVDQTRYLFEDFQTIDPKAAEKHLTTAAIAPLQLLHQKLTELTEWTAPAIHHIMEATALELNHGMGKIGMPLRVAITGQGTSPAIDAVAVLIGKTRVLQRIEQAVKSIP
jgi:glutamyl-tRNA synthetase